MVVWLRPGLTRDLEAPFIFILNKSKRTDLKDITGLRIVQMYQFSRLMLADPNIRKTENTQIRF